MLFQLKIILFLGILSGVSAFEKIVIVVLENQDYAVAIQDPSLSEIVSQGVLLTDYHAVTHPSQPNYYAIVAGDTFFNDDNLHDINAKTIVDELEKKGLTWKAYMEDMPSACFLDENINNWYKQERMMSLLFSIAAAIAIILSCMGLLAMVLLIIQQRVKEIGVRKVLGASVQNIALLISKDFLKLVFIAVLISTPLAWLTMNKWLQGFPYRITIEWWMFALVAVAALLIALLTISINTIRAAMQNPVKSLRTE